MNTPSLSLSLSLFILEHITSMDESSKSLLSLDRLSLTVKRLSLSSNH